MKVLTILGKEIELIRTRRRTLGLEVGPRGIKARAPLRMPEHEIITFIHSKEQWLNKVLGAMPEPRPNTNLALQTGDEILFEGKTLRLQIIEGSRDRVRIEGSTLVVPVIKSHTPVEKRVKSKLVKWFKQQATQQCQLRAEFYAPRMNLERRKQHQIYVRDYKRRWGSCDSTGKLSFNWRIMQAPPEVLDYVVVHELAHCHEFNHSLKFWSLVYEQMANYKQNEAWLHQQGYTLYRF